MSKASDPLQGNGQLFQADSIDYRTGLAIALLPGDAQTIANPAKLPWVVEVFETINFQTFPEH
ncbi:MULTISPECIES: hypothetical protein [unclassified Leptolyngbya]|uniref:hypothetical protein n=1 Tax=unclassified Leptolyngbya TaxID=2650499 RepID=UPI00168969CA|nr:MULTISPECIES: hypothetical protein [unclassified Leptolyngbya]MBD1911399.1 hypothetical protein [Leptolyngbya sp. FACHB-8]MBD2159025.1 hypothetical protein [Leptolyngbya sp. FACHB-16]